MGEAAERQDYELAAVYRDRLRALTYIQGSQAIHAERLGDADLFALACRITADGDRWCWRLKGIKALGVSVAPNFLEEMTFEPEHHIGFRPATDVDQRAGAEGTYDLEDAPDGATKLTIDITITVELPLPRASKRAVEKVMASTMNKTGDRFARNLYEAHAAGEDRPAGYWVAHTVLIVVNLVLTAFFARYAWRTLRQA